MNSYWYVINGRNSEGEYVYVKAKAKKKSTKDSNEDKAS